MTTDGFLPWSTAPLEAGWEAAGAIVLAPFTGASDDFALFAEAPAAAGGVWVAVLVALAYDFGAGCCAGTAPVVKLLGLAEGVMAARGGFEALGRTTLVIGSE